MTDQLNEGAGEQVKTGRPKADISASAVKQLASIFATHEEMAAFFCVSKRTIIRRLKEPELRNAYAEGLGLAKISLRRLQWRHARGEGSAAVNMTIHLSKHHLGETDKAALELSGRVDATVEVTSAKERIAQKLQSVAERVQGRVAGVLTESGSGLVPQQS